MIGIYFAIHALYVSVCLHCRASRRNHRLLFFNLQVYLFFRYSLLTCLINFFLLRGAILLFLGRCWLNGLPLELALINRYTFLQIIDDLQYLFIFIPLLIQEISLSLHRALLLFFTLTLAPWWFGKVLSDLTSQSCHSLLDKGFHSFLQLCGYLAQIVLNTILEFQE